MSSDLTQLQGGDELERAAQLSRQRGYPPCEVPGYEPRRFLGNGAYGEVWVATDRTTGRQVAIKFYLHRGGLDWSLLSHEVEKLVFLSADRYVVQLLDVGWESEPPYYVMEYVENGSLDDRLRQQGKLPAAEATALFRELAVGLMHSHGKGVLHCDLKPANILLDQDGKPRLADFGQSRFSSEQTPALGTLFYMAPEQADSKAVPDARWDVYALGAIFYAMLTGHPPHRHEKTVTEIESVPELERRLGRYRQLIESSPPPSEHRHLRGVDKRLATIIDRCLTADPHQRYPTVQSVLDALDARDRHRSLSPLMVLGALGPLLLLAIMGILAWQGFSASLGHFNDGLTQSALTGLGFAAESVARGASAELQSRFYDVEEAARDKQVVDALNRMETDPKMSAALKVLATARMNESVEQLVSSKDAKALQDCLESFDKSILLENKTSEAWFITDSRGVQLAHWYQNGESLGHNYSWRSYFYGGNIDQPDDWRPRPDQHIEKTHLSAVFSNYSTDVWVTAISAPIYKDPDTKTGFLGVIGVSFKLGKNFINFADADIGQQQVPTQFPVLVDARKGDHTGLILQHPLFHKLARGSGAEIPVRFQEDKKYRVPADRLAELQKDGITDYEDPIAADKEGEPYRTTYLAAEAPIEVVEGHGDDAKQVPTGLVVIVQDPYKLAIGDSLTQLGNTLLGIGLVGLGVIGLVIVGMWWLVLRMLEKPTRWQPTPLNAQAKSAETIPPENQN